MRKTIVAGNWKMNLNMDEAETLVSDLAASAEFKTGLDRILIFPPYLYLDRLQKLSPNEQMCFGAQNVAAEENGAYTGEVSASMLKAMGIDYCLVGHSERRQYYHENYEILKEKVNRAIENNLIPVFCCGEQLSDRESGRHQAVVSEQLQESLFHLTNDQFEGVIIAYEPVWAIGTGVTASAEQAEEMHAFIRSLLHGRYGSLSEKTAILYGGSCKASNSVELFSQPNVDGGLIGGASLEAEEFLTIISNVNG